MGPRPGRTKTAVEAVFTGKERHYNRRFLQMCSHYLGSHARLWLGLRRGGATGSSPLAQGQVENQVGLVRERFFTPRLRVKNLDELNAWLLDKCVAYAKAHRHPEEADKTIWKMFEDEPLKAPSVRAQWRAPRSRTGCSHPRWPRSDAS